MLKPVSTCYIKGAFVLLSITRIKIAGVLLAITLLPVHGLADTFNLEGRLTVYKKGGKQLLESFENTVVFLEGIATDAPDEPAELVQRDKQFTPRILPVIKGQAVRFYNHDRFEHNVFSTDKRNSFDLGRYPMGEYRDRVYDEVGTYKVYCNIHKAMIMDIVVVPGKYFATTDKQGNYRIDNVPAGEYTLKAWHIYGGAESIPVSVTTDLTVPEMKLHSKRVVRDIQNHKNKYGRSYPDNSDDPYY